MTLTCTEVQFLIKEADNLGPDALRTDVRKMLTEFMEHIQQNQRDLESRVKDVEREMKELRECERDEAYEMLKKGEIINQY